MIRENKARFDESDVKEWQDNFAKSQNARLRAESKLETAEASGLDTKPAVEKEVSEIDKLRAELKAAEEKLKAAEAAEKAKIEAAKTNEKAELAHKIEAAYKELVAADEEAAKVIAEANKKRAEKFKVYNQLKNDFIEKYGSFHMTYVDKQPVVSTENANNEVKQISFNDLFDYFSNRFWKF